MIKLLVDENFNNAIIRSVRLRVPYVEIVRVQDTEISGKADPHVLDWAAANGFVLLTHDINTMRGLWYSRVERGLRVPGLLLVHATDPIGPVVYSLELILLASDDGEWESKIEYLPL